MNFGGGRGKLEDAKQVAAARWDAAGEVWGDSVRREHDAEVVTPLHDAVDDLLRAVDRLATAFASAKRECEFDPLL